LIGISAIKDVRGGEGFDSSPERCTIMLRDRLQVNNAKACHNADRQTREIVVLDVDVIFAWIFVGTARGATDHDDVGLDIILLGSKVEVT
jgi:hypothetical protein